MTTPLGGLPYPTNPAAAADIIAIVGNLAKAVDSKLTNRYPNAGARNAAFDAWVAAGNTMVDGLHSTVAGVDQVYRSGSWHGIGPNTVLIGTPLGPYVTPVGDNDFRDIGQINVPDPGFPYRLRTYASSEIYFDAGTRPDSLMRVGNSRWDFVAGFNFHHKHADISGIFTGSQTLLFSAYKGVGTGTWWQIQSNPNFYFTAEVVPA